MLHRCRGSPSLACTTAEEELPPEWELYLEAVTAAQERWRAEQVVPAPPLARRAACLLPYWDQSRCLSSNSRHLSCRQQHKSPRTLWSALRVGRWDASGCLVMWVLRTLLRVPLCVSLAAAKLAELTSGLLQSRWAAVGPAAARTSFLYLGESQLDLVAGLLAALQCPSSARQHAY